MGMTQVVLHYAHTFEIFIFHFQLLTHQTDPYRHKEHVSKKWLKSHNRYIDTSFIFKKSVFKVVVVVVVVLLDPRISKTPYKNLIWR